MPNKTLFELKHLLKKWNICIYLNAMWSLINIKETVNMQIII